jgi:hypothetical protein
MRRLDEPLPSLLGSMYRDEPQVGTDGRYHELDGLTRLAPTEGMWLHDLCRPVKPEKALDRRFAFPTC